VHGPSVHTSLGRIGRGGRPSHSSLALDRVPQCAFGCVCVGGKRQKCTLTSQRTRKQRQEGQRPWLAPSK
jgi:hypothetical protein